MHIFIAVAGDTGGRRDALWERAHAVSGKQYR